ncbi:hypothetical protein [Azospirillum sp. SYSU D00513]|uniref:hypothetical protein n=1 Tax=Azospirillum sp. SYSU D00513 TaxID=2812561 RepID=UPI001A97C4C2|nr:hypothetical protein [Azospirillum sp. SYSU D00513]
MPIRTLLLPLCLAFALFGHPAKPRAAEAEQHLFYEALPGAGPDVPYEERRRLTEQVRDALVPEVLRLSGIAPGAAVTDLRMGGYLLRTNPSLHTRSALADAPADRLGAALALALHQDSVLVADFAGGNTGYALVRFPEGGLTPELAQRFFRAAAAVHKGLGGGYTALGDSLLFLNLRGEDGAPYSGLEDASFLVALSRAAERFAEAPVTVAETGRADARLVGANGPEAAAIGDSGLAALGPLRGRFDALLKGLGAARHP